tara:strand:+ start:279 stop:1259 length:981 start_codon:yes stop_codon:yes gene_type:complete
MIIKPFEINKVKGINKKIFLFYGDNIGQKDEIIRDYFLKSFDGEVMRIAENEVLNRADYLISELLNNSLFNEDKLIIISQITHKIIDFVEEVNEREIKNVKIILISEALDKKSKLRSLFEKDKKLYCVPFYEDNEQSLNLIANNFFKSRNIKISREIINLIIERCKGDRGNLKNELSKIENFSHGKKSIDIKDVVLLTNISKNYSVNELVDSYLAKNTKKIYRILNENIFSNEDCILILRSLLSKSKRLLKLREQFDKKESIEDVVSNFRPPIFWKDKDNVKKQIQSWSLKEVRNLIYETSDIEILVKKNSSNSVNFIRDFVSNYK